MLTPSYVEIKRRHNTVSLLMKLSLYKRAVKKGREVTEPSFSCKYSLSKQSIVVENIFSGVH